MSTNFTASLRTRVTKETKRAYEKLAKQRGVKEAHLQRQALTAFAAAELAKQGGA